MHHEEMASHERWSIWLTKDVSILGSLRVVRADKYSNISLTLIVQREIILRAL